MATIFTHVPYAGTGYFSHLVNDYTSDISGLQSFFTYNADYKGITRSIESRNKYSIDRKALVSTLEKQYADLPKYTKTEENIQLLLKEDTFTICTAHQPNLLTGYLYFVYKILHAIKLAEELNKKHPAKHFVPVYYMGSEDNDIEELGTFRFRDEKYVWDGSGQSGAVGRMNTAGLKPLLNELLNVFGPPGKNCDDLQTMITEAYLKHKTIATATHYLVNELFGRYGLVVLNPDEAALKASFIPVMEDELLHQRSLPIINQQIEKLGTHYKVQAHPREINLFYLTDQLRERIEKKGDKWVVVNTDIQWTQQEVIAELKQHPERFSPNVMLRGLYQETILPDVAFIGGGAEVAYWLQLKPLFEHYNVFFPAIILRQSVLWIGSTPAKLRKQMELSIPDIFKQENALVHDYVNKHSTHDWQTSKETAAIATIFESLKQKAGNLDPTLAPSAEAALTKMKRQLTILEKKMLRAEKRKMQTQLQRISRLKNNLFPASGLQERIENFTEYYLQYGPAFFDIVKDAIEPLRNEFLVVEDDTASS